MESIRPAAVAGMFYPGQPGPLTAAIDDCFAHAAKTPVAGAGVPKAMIVPHAGYVYSGPIAATAYARLQPAREIITRVVLFGPAHRAAVRGLVLPEARVFETPLGRIEIDQEAIRQLDGLPFVGRSDHAHALEHSLEVQLPFLQKALARFTLVPFAVGDATPDQVAQVMERLWGGPETLVLVSSDLSHYHPYREAAAIDRETAQHVLELRPTLDHEQACGATPINGLLQVAPKHGLVPALLDLRNSGDTAGDRSRVVGYASFAFTEPRHA